MQESLRKLIQHDEGRYTTAEALSFEKSILAMAQQGVHKSAPIVENTQKALAENPWSLNAGQQQAVELALNSQDQFLLWHGVAGAGKTYAMNVVRELSGTKKVQLRGFAPSAEAAKVLETEAKIPSQTVANLLVNPYRLSTGSKREVWIVDEAGLLSARDCARLMHRAVDEQAKVVFVGDTRQLSAVEAGNPFRLLRDHNVATAELSESRRQKNQALKDSVDLMAEGQQREAMQAISAQVVELKREQTRIQFITKEWMQMPVEQRSKSLILAGTNRERELLTSEIRNSLKGENQLQGATIVKTLHARDLSREELGDVVRLQTGDVLIFHKQAKENGIAKGEMCTILSTDAKLNTLTLRSDDGPEIIFNPRKHQASFTAYKAKETEVCVGEKMRWTKNDKTLGVRNGEDGVLESIEGNALHIKSPTGKITKISADERLHLDHNYVNTVYSSQGKTCDNVIISVDKTFGKEAMYVALSRAKFGARIVTPDKDEMLRIVGQSRSKISAIDLLPEEKNELFRQQRPEQKTDLGQKQEIASSHRRGHKL